MTNFDADVIVVGGGPVGLMLAGELQLTGSSVIILERLARPVRESKALGFTARVIEEFGQRGLLPRFGEINTIPMGHFGGLLIDFRVLEGASYGARGIPQARTEAVLAEWAAELGADLRRGHEVIGLAVDDAGVTVDVRGPDGPVQLRSAYVVGCDGAHSTVRTLAGIDFPGTEPTLEMLMADVTGVDLAPRFTGQRVPDGMVMVIPAGPGVHRIGLYERGRGMRRDAGAADFQEIADGWERLTGEDIHAATPLWISSFTDSSRLAAEYRRGRLLLAGDAAHVHQPQGGQGMSGGIGDAMNLAWKLSAELQGQAPAGLLDTFHSERHPVGARIVANTLAQGLLYLSGDELQPLRDILQELLGYESVQRHLIGMVSGLDIRYDVGPGDHPLLGRRLPDHELVGDFGGFDKSTAYEQLHDARFVLFDLADDARLRAAAAPWSSVRVVTATAHTGSWADVDGLDALLVRPDGYVAWVARSGAGPEHLTESLTRWVGPVSPA